MSEQDRIALVQKLIHQKMDTSRALVQYLETRRAYDSESNLYMREAHFIIAVKPGEGCSMSQVAQQLNVTPGAVSQTAKRLEAKGYIIRSKSGENQRQTIALLTKKGEEFYNKHLQYDRDKLAAMDAVYFSRFSDEELLRLLEYETVVQAFATKEISPI